MDLGIIPMRYAKALLRFATEGHEEERVYAEMTSLAQTFVKLPALHQAMINPVVTDEQKLQLLLTAAGGGEKTSETLQRFLPLVVKKQRTASMMLIAHSYGTLYRRSKHIIQGELVVPTDVTPHLVEKLKQWVEEKSQCRVDYRVVVDPSIQGGFILSYDTYRLDASVRTRLAKIKRELSL